jgi:hypothetical protein
MLILKNIQTTAFQTASGFCTTSQEFLDMANQVIPRLLQRGDWPGSMLPIRVCIKNGCCTWPRYVGQVRRLHGCRGDIPMKSLWYEFLDYQGDRHLHEWDAWRRGERRMINQFQSPVYNDIYGPNCYVRLYCDLTADLGATCTIFGTDNNNQPLMTLNPDGTATPGAVITVDLQGDSLYGATSTPVSHIDRVVCSQTQGMKRLYAWDANQAALYDLAIYEPSETVPSYVRQQLEGERRGMWGGAGCGGGCNNTVIALVKLKFLPLITPTDGLIFLEGAQGPLLNAFRAVKREEANDAAGAGSWWKAAVEELNRQFEDFMPDDQLAAINNVFADRTFCNTQF